MFLLYIPGFSLLIYALLNPDTGVGSGRVFLAIMLILLAMLAQIFVRWDARLNAEYLARHNAEKLAQEPATLEDFHGN